MSPKATVIVFPGSNCNEESHAIMQRLGFDVSYTWYKDSLPKNLDFIFIPGGFSYGDRLRSGAIASFSNIIQEVKAFAEKGGYVMGVCNGFQVLTESLILEGALLRNASSSFICKVIEIHTTSQSSYFTKNTPQTMTMQIAHADGRYFCHNDTLKKLQDNNQIAFTYKEDINGSIANIAGIFGGKNNNILGMMPHPERDIIAHTNGSEIFKSLFKNL
ncbi:MAG: phosphoribosylformylglycinamidine synthase I [Candidatus Deianiraeaceae bacterium]|jgi:phosphoribosylformylglycinamidine synthase I